MNSQRKWTGLIRSNVIVFNRKPPVRKATVVFGNAATPILSKVTPFLPPPPRLPWMHLRSIRRTYRKSPTFASLGVHSRLNLLHGSSKQQVTIVSAAMNHRHVEKVEEAHINKCHRTTNGFTLNGAWSSPSKARPLRIEPVGVWVTSPLAAASRRSPVFSSVKSAPIGS